MAERVGFEPTVPVRVRRFSRPFRYDHFGISPFVATIFYHNILSMSIDFLKLSLFFLVLTKVEGASFVKLPFSTLLINN